MLQFKKFCLIGGLGFVVDSLCFIFLTKLTSNIMLARVLSFWLAASTTWFGNRIYTYAHQQFSGVITQWCKHLLTTHLSGVINLLIFWSIKDVVTMPVAFCLGILGGLFSNYFFANHFVFAQRSPQ
jgi:putative flippase GtrA